MVSSRSARIVSLEGTYSEDSNASDYTGILWGCEGIVGVGEVSLSGWTSGVRLLDLNALLFGCHFRSCGLFGRGSLLEMLG